MDTIVQTLPPPKSKFFSFPTPLFHNNYLFKNLNVINNKNRIKIKENAFYFFLDIYLEVSSCMTPSQRAVHVASIHEHLWEVKIH